MKNKRQERPIIFNSRMVNAILHGSKTQTRRPITTLTGIRNGRIKEFQRSYAKGYDWTFRDWDGLWSGIRHETLLDLCPFGKVGDRLYVRETWRLARDWASRITLEITGIKIDRLRDISKADAIAEGMTSVNPREEFFKLWESIYGVGNPFVWVIEFKRVVAGE